MCINKTQTFEIKLQQLNETNRNTTTCPGQIIKINSIFIFGTGALK
jgi:hypothetical protein